MSNNYYHNLINILIDNHIISSDDAPIYLYGLRKIFISGLNYFFLGVAAFVLQVPFYALLFSITFIPLRIYGGGIHAKNEINCFLFSNIVIYLALWSINYSSLKILVILLGINVVMFLFLYNYIPVNCNKDIWSNNEKLRFRNKFICIELIEYVVTLVMLILKEYSPAYAIQIAIFSENILGFFTKA